MVSNISFGSMFNPERISRENLENVEATPEFEGFGREEVEPAKAFPMYPQESLGRSQVKTSEPFHLSENTKQILSNSNSKKYGFGPNNDFWVHSRSKNEDGAFQVTLGDGKLKEGMTPQDFIMGLINEDTKAIHLSCKNENDNKNISAMFVYDKEANDLYFYSNNTNGEEICLESVEPDALKIIIEEMLFDYGIIHGATIWS